MSNLPKGEKLNQPYQLQNVVTGIILRQTTPFHKREILIKVDEWCEGSCFAKNGSKRNEVDLEMIIEETLNTFWVIGAVSYNYDDEMYKIILSWPSV